MQGLIRLILLALTALHLWPAAFAQPPSDFRMTVISEPIHMADNIDQLRLDINAQGAVDLHVFRDGSGKIWPDQTVSLSDANMATLFAAITENEFFGLDDVYGDQEVFGGDKAIIVITANGRTKEVITVNIKVTDFDDIIRTLNELLPADRKVYYNALSPYASDYKEVKR